jgi:hypothetical protein
MKNIIMNSEVKQYSFEDVVKFAIAITNISKFKYIDEDVAEKLLIEWHKRQVAIHNEIHNSEIGKKFRLAEANQISEDYENMYGYDGL